MAALPSQWLVTMRLGLAAVLVNGSGTGSFTPERSRHTDRSMKPAATTVPVRHSVVPALEPPGSALSCRR